MATQPLHPQKLSAAQARVLARIARDGDTLCEDALDGHGDLIAEDQPTQRVAAATLRALKDGGLIEQSVIQGWHPRRACAAEYRVTSAGQMALARYDLDHSGRPTNKRAYGLLLAVSRRVGWPILYATDLLIHDRDTLTHLGAPAVFGWRLGDCGTDLFAAGDAQALVWAEACARSDAASHWYWYEGGVLGEVGASTVLRRLAQGIGGTAAREAAAEAAPQSAQP